MTSSYPEPIHKPAHRHRPVHPRSLLPLSLPPLPKTLPTLPSPLREPVFPGYTLTTHIFPAAYPRMAPDVPLPEPLENQSCRRQRAAWAERNFEAFRKAERELMREKDIRCSEKVLWCCVNRYVKKGLPGASKTNRKGVTLFFAHANGFLKEVCQAIYFSPYCYLKLARYGSQPSLTSSNLQPPCAIS
jgi:hypothetical protein